MMKFRTREQAERWVRETFRSEFGEDTHELFYEKQPERWTYREGD
jgi:hypothetical protein